MKASGGNHGARRRIRPGRVWYVVCVVVVLLGVLYGVWAWVIAARGMMEGLVRSPEGTMTVTFAATGSYTLFAERAPDAAWTLDDDTLAAGLQRGDLTIDVRGVDTGVDGATRPLPGSVSYRMHGVAGVGIAALEVPRPGTYEVEVARHDGRGEELTYAIDAAGVMGVRFFATILSGALVPAFAVGAAVLGAVLVAVLRYVAIRRVVPTTVPTIVPTRRPGTLGNHTDLPAPPTSQDPPPPWPPPPRRSPWREPS